MEVTEIYSKIYMKIGSNTINFQSLAENFYENPYETWHLLNLRWNNLNNLEESENIQEICFESLLKLIQTSNNTENIAKLWCLLSCIKLETYFSKEKLNTLVTAVIENLNSDHFFILYLSLLSRDNNNTINNVILQDSERGFNDISFRSIILNVINKQQHFLDILLKGIKDFDNKTNQSLKFIKLISVCNKKIYENSSIIENILKEIKFEDFTNFLQSYLYEIKRQINITNLITNSSDLVSSFNAIEFLLDNPHLLKNDYIQINNFIKINNEIRDKIYELNCGNNLEFKNYESEIFDVYSILIYYLEIIFLDQTSIDYENKIDNNLVKIRNLLRIIDNNEKYVQILENIFSLLFLRTEHLNNSQKYLNSRKSSQTKTFVCSNFILEKILYSLKLSITFIKQSDKFKLNENFEIISKYINNAIWRLSLLTVKLNDNIDIRFKVNNVKDIKNLLIPYNLVKSNTSSDDGDNNNIFIDKNKRSSITRRKRRKRHSIHKSDSDKNTSTNTYSYTTGSDNIINQENNSVDRIVSLDDNFKRINIITEMLYNEESLITTCINRKDLDSAKQIIKTYNMENTQIDFDIKFSENLELTKIKLKEIFQKFYENNNKKQITNLTQIEIIKTVAAIGIETSKYINIIEKFVLKYKIPILNENLLQKHKANYSFLILYLGNQLQVTTVFDIILSLNTKYDTNVNLLNLISRHWNRDLTQETNNMGYYGLLKKLFDSINEYNKIREDNIGVERLLINECYSLNLINIIEQLEKEKIFKKVFNLTNQELDDSIKCLNQIKNKLNYIHRINIYQDNIRKLINVLSLNDDIITINDLIQLNLNKKIGEIIFEYDINPLNIESIIENLNINFIHAITLNCCSAIKFKINEKNNKIIVLNEIITNLKNGNFEEILNECNENDKYYELKNTNIIDYLKQNNFLIAFLIKEFHNLNYDVNLCYNNNNYLNNLKGIESVKKSKVFYENNLFLAALNYDHIDLKKLSKFLLHSTPTVALDILRNIKEIEIKDNQQLYYIIIDYFNKKLINECLDEKSILLIEQINDLNKRSELLKEILINIKDADIIERLIKSILLDNDSYKLDKEQKEYLFNSINNIKIYQEISMKILIPLENVMKLSYNSPEDIFNQLIIKNEFDLCLKWIKIHPLINYPTKSSNFQLIFAISLRQNSLSFTKNMELLKLIQETLKPLDVLIKFYNKMLLQLKNLHLIKYILNYLTANTNNNKQYQKYLISMKIFELITNDEVNLFLPLFSRPLLLIEQYLMNSKFEILTKIMSSIKMLLLDNTCNICYENRCNKYDTKLFDDYPYYTDQTDDFILFNIDYDHNNGEITEECIDTLLRNYATKSLDIRINELQTSTNDFMSQTTDTDTGTSLDSLYGAFIMPKEAPTKDLWIRDEEQTICMCCKLSIFSLLTRRHHCRRCGRIICHLCSLNRMKIKDIYDDILVRVCIDCFKQTEKLANKLEEKNLILSNTDTIEKKDGTNSNDWKLCGNLKHDNLVRDEFCYEYAPSVSLCLSILAYHSSRPDCSYFLLHQCKKFQKLLRPLQIGYPNPEIDYILVTQILHCLALAAKVRGGSTECNTVIDHAEIILSIVQNGCESLLPTEPLTTMSFRKLRDSLVIAEKWSLALELSLKCGYPTNGIMFAWGISSLKAGCYETAREKLSYCMTRVTTDENNTKLLNLIDTGSNMDLQKIDDIIKVLRPTKSPPILSEILAIIETNYPSYPDHPDVKTRATNLLNSNTSLTSIISKKRDNIPINEPALNIFHTLSNLKQITNGIYNSNENINKKKSKDSKNKTMKHDENIKHTNITKTRYYEECIYYLTCYGSHNDIILFLMKHNQIISVLKYLYLQNVETEIFINSVFLPQLKNGNVEILISLMIDFNETLLIWKDYILQTCRYLETKCMYNCLYQMQILLKDPIRCVLSCVKFYSMNCNTFTELLNNNFHLLNAKKHLENELELCQWEEIKVDTEEVVESLLMKMGSKELNNHINTILQQMEVTKFLTGCETNGINVIELLRKIFTESTRIPTLFDTLQEKIQLTVLILISGKNIEEGFGLAFRIIQDFNLKSTRTYGITAKFLSGNSRISEVERLIDCIKSNTEKFNCDEILCLSVHTYVDIYGTQIKTDVENLIRLINDIGLRINCHILSGQLKSAYLLAVQYNRLNDVKKIMKQAELTNNQIIKKLCAKKLNIK